MKRLNLLYLFVILTAILLFQIGRKFNRHAIVFYGFAENKETEINLDYPVEVNRLYVTTGQRVKKGTLLAEVSRPELKLKKNEIDFKLDELQAEKQLRNADLNAKLIQLKAEKKRKASEIVAKIRQLQTEIDLNRALVSNLKSLQAGDSTVIVGPELVKINGLKEALTLSDKTYDLQIEQLEFELNSGETPVQAQIAQLEDEKLFYTEEEGKLQIIAPTDGLIGNIHCKEAENIAPFSTLITFYEENPTLVKAFVHESMILEVQEGDTLEVYSSLHPEHRCLGVVTGLGSRIIEVPERLRKIPERKTYGREVLVSIPPVNHFLQKEKVVLDLNRTVSVKNYIFSLSQQISEPDK